MIKMEENKIKLDNKIEYVLTTPISDLFDRKRSLNEKILVENLSQYNIRMSRANRDITLIGMGVLLYMGGKLSEGVADVEAAKCIRYVYALGGGCLGLASCINEFLYEFLRYKSRSKQ